MFLKPQMSKSLQMCVCVVLAGFHPVHLEFVRVFLLLCVDLLLFACPALSTGLYVCVCARVCVRVLVLLTLAP